MIVFDRLWDVMKKQGVSTYQLREKCGIDSQTIRRLRANEMSKRKLWTNCAAHCRAVWRILRNTSRITLNSSGRPV